MSVKRPMTERHKEMFKQPMRFFFSGIESKNHFHLAEQAGVKTFLTAFLHARKALSKKSEMERRFGGTDHDLIVDSSTYTFHANIEEYGDKKKYPISHWEKFLKDYLEWIEKNQEYISYFVELDITGVVGVDKVLEWRKTIIEPFEDRTGIVCMYMFQPEYSMQFWEEMCQRYHYVGFSGEAGFSDKQMQQMFKIAKKYNTLCHGMAFTKIEKLRTGKYPFWSIDSTSWKMSERYGVTYIWDGKNFLQFDKTKKHTRKKYKRIMQRQGIDWDKIKADDASENTKMALIAWMGVTAFVSDYMVRTGKCYWLEDTEALRKKAKEYIDTPIESTEPIFPPPESRWEEDEETYSWEDVATSLNINPKCEETSIVLTIIDIFNCLLHEDSEEHQAYLFDILEKNEAIVDYIYDIFVEKRYEPENDYSNWLEIPPTWGKFIYEELAESGGEAKFNSNDLMKLSILSEVAPKVVYHGLPLFQSEAEETSDTPVEPQEREVYAGDEDRNQLAVMERDEMGRFRDGNSIHLKRSKSIMSHMPMQNCDTCYLADNCPHFKPHSVCYYNKELNKFDTRNMQDVLEMSADMVNMNAQRLMMARIFEITDGGMPDKTVTDLISMQMGLLNQQLNLLKASQPRTAHGGEVQISASGDAGNSIIAKLFGGMGGQEPPVETARKDVTPEMKNSNPLDIVDADFFDLTEADDELADKTDWGDEEDKPKKKKKIVKKRKKQ